ncbi:MAG: hypothetical protein GWP06_03695 [Actinobacteria bacterium]|nr:hypothetical protein [Actinomycetota bacterium]
MLCNSCGHRNKENASYCTECGWKLTKTLTTRKPCPRCGFENAVDANYCSNCGEHISGSRKKQKVNGKGKNSRTAGSHSPVTSSTAKLVAGLTTAAIVLILLIKFLAPSEPVAVQQLPSADASLNLIMNAQILGVAKQFRCSCGTCGGTPLEECSCPTAEKEKSFIASHLQKGKTVEQTVALVDSVYGWKKNKAAGVKENG